METQAVAAYMAAEFNKVSEFLPFALKDLKHFVVNQYSELRINETFS
jgi:hypothetical protein